MILVFQKSLRSISPSKSSVELQHTLLQKSLQMKAMKDFSLTFGA